MILEQNKIVLNFHNLQRFFKRSDSDEAQSTFMAENKEAEWKEMQSGLIYFFFFFS